MSMAGSFLGGAKDRLLPVSIPFGFFLSATIFQVLTWLFLFFGSGEVATYSGGSGPVLAAIHLATLGVFTMTAVGASYQLFPVVTRRALLRTWPARLSFWLLACGISLLCLGMGLTAHIPMQSGAVLVASGLGVFAMLTADNLRRAGAVPVVAMHIWAGLAALLVFSVLGFILVWDFEGLFLSDRTLLARAHLLFASYGFMGLLVGGLSLILIPMFVLSRNLPEGLGRIQLGFAVVGLTGVAGSLLITSKALLGLAVIAGIMAAFVFLWQMILVLKSSMRKRLGLSFILIRSSWVFLIVSLLLGAELLAGLGIPNASALFGFILLAGWLMTFLTGVLQRIMPFLASMHASGISGLPMLMSELVAETPLKIHAGCHFAALAMVGGGIVLNQTLFIQAGAGVGTIGALAFFIFAVNIWLKLRASQAGDREIKRGKRRKAGST